jgi:tellurite resistance protein TerA
MELVRGQKLKIAGVLSGMNFEVRARIASGAAIDVSCFGLDADRKLTDDRYFVFYNQTASPCAAVVLKEPGVFSVNLATLPSSVKYLVFAATLDGAGGMGAIGPSSLSVFDGGEEKLTFRFQGSDFSSEKAIMLAEFYFKDEWRFTANGQGFKDGLSALLKSFGGEEIAPAPPPPPTGAPTVSLSKVTLEKRGESKKIDLAKKGEPKDIHINLQWDEPAKKGGFFGRLTGGQSADLDLGCMYRLKNGDMGVIQPLGGNFGSKTTPPFIFLDKDDRSGAAADGENMYIFHPEEIDLMVVFAMIYEGTALFSSVHGRVTIKDAGGSEIVIPLNNASGDERFCAVARIESASNGVNIIKDELYFRDHQFCDRHYGFGFRWKAGKK